MSRFLFRAVCWADPEQINLLWRRSFPSHRQFLHVNPTHTPDVLGAAVLGDDPLSWWYGHGAGCAVISGENELGALSSFLAEHRELFDRIEYVDDA